MTAVQQESHNSGYNAAKTSKKSSRNIEIKTTQKQIGKIGI